MPAIPGGGPLPAMRGLGLPQEYTLPPLEIARKADRGRTIRQKMFDGTTSERELLSREEMAQRDIQDRVASIRGIGDAETQQKIAEGRQIRESLGLPATQAVRAGTGLDKVLPREAISLYGAQQASDRALTVQQEIAQRASDAQVAQDQRAAQAAADRAEEGRLNRENRLKVARMRAEPRASTRDTVAQLASRAMEDSIRGGGNGYDDAIRNAEQFYRGDPEMNKHRAEVVSFIKTLRNKDKLLRRDSLGSIAARIKRSSPSGQQAPAAQTQLADPLGVR
jgi:hypothetical protein